jgi:hypothetical protein
VGKLGSSAINCDGVIKLFFSFFPKNFVLEKLTDYYEMEQTWTNLTWLQAKVSWPKASVHFRLESTLLT